MAIESWARLKVLHQCEEAKNKPPQFWVYMALCQDDGPIYIKVGYSVRPDKRLYNLKTGMPIPIHQYYVCEIGSKQRAKIVEAALHLGLSKWAISGEWFRVSAEDKQEFNAAWRSVFAQQSTRTKTLRWERASPAAIKAAADRSKVFFLKRMLRRTNIRALQMIPDDSRGLTAGPDF